MVRPQAIRAALWVRPLRPNGASVAGSRACLSAARVGGGVVSVKFVVASLSDSPRSRISRPLALSRVAGLVTARSAGPWP